MSGPGAEGLPPLSAYDELDPSAGHGLSGDFWDGPRQCPAADEKVPHHAHRWDENDVPGQPFCAGFGEVAAARCPSCRPVGGGYCQTCGKPL